jgi:F0F1-type ATP synthase gamma subunit
LLCCFLLDYWLALESIALLLTVLITAANLTERLLPKPEQVRAEQEDTSVFQSFLEERSSSIQADVAKMCQENHVFRAFIEAQVSEISYHAIAMK